MYVLCINDTQQTTINTMKEKNLSIELLKFIALFIIANSHMELLYGEYSILATGGSIGDVLFFFCSGYTLFLGRMDRFDNWYKRRVNRIYPSIFAWALIASLFFDMHYDMKEIWLHAGGWFVTCIMLYYVILYFVRKYFLEKEWIVFILTTLIIAIYYLFEDRSKFFMYGDTYFKWVHYFIFMLIGAYIGVNKIKLTIRPTYDLVGFIISIITYYVAMFLCVKSPAIAEWQILTLIPLMGITIYLYKLCSSSWCTVFLNKNKGWVCAISGLCLESYIVQYALFTDKMNSIFPLNVIITMIAILIMAYLVRSVGRIFAQIFSKENFDWKAIIKL